PVVASPPGDRRFADRAWKDNPWLRSVLESYLVSAQWWRDRVDESHLDDADRRRARFAVNAMLDAAAPTNLPLLNPAVVKAAIDQGQRITGAPRVNLAGLCLGGTYAVLAAAHLTARRQADRLGWVTVTNTLVDFSEPGDLGVFTDPGAIQRLEKAMSRKGYLD